jgi:hypothetical protein
VSKKCFPRKGQNQMPRVFSMYAVHTTWLVLPTSSLDVPCVMYVSPSQHFHISTVWSFGLASELSAKGINKKHLRKVSTLIHSFSISKLIGHHTTWVFIEPSTFYIGDPGRSTLWFHFNTLPFFPQRRSYQC